MADSIEAGAASEARRNKQYGSEHGPMDSATQASALHGTEAHPKNYLASLNQIIKKINVVLKNLRKCLKGISNC